MSSLSSNSKKIQKRSNITLSRTLKKEKRPCTRNEDSIPTPSSTEAKTLDLIKFSGSKDMYYTKEILLSNLSEQKKLKKLTYPEINRSVVLDWMLNVFDNYSCSSETYFLAVSYLDEFCSKIRTPLIKQIAAISLLLATKYNEVQPLSLKVLFEKVVRKKYCIEELKMLEVEMLQTLDFKLHEPTVYDFCKLTMFLFQNIFPKNEIIETEKFHTLIGYLCKLSTFDFEIFRLYKPSDIAAGILFFAFEIFQKFWTEIKLPVIKSEISRVLKVPSTKISKLKKKILEFGMKFEDENRFKILQKNYQGFLEEITVFK